MLGYQFAHFFNGYAQIFNLQTDRTGKLFDYPFRRIEVQDEAYFSQLIYYIYHNPQKHGLIADFREYPHSSYHSHLSNRATKLQREAVIYCQGLQPRHDHCQRKKNIRWQWLKTLTIVYFFACNAMVVFFLRLSRLAAIANVKKT